MHVGDGLVGSMVAALRRVNREWAGRPPAAQPKAAPRSENPAWGYLVHPSLMPTVYCPNDDAGDETGEDVTARKV